MACIFERRYHYRSLSYVTLLKTISGKVWICIGQYLSTVYGSGPYIVVGIPIQAWISMIMIVILTFKGDPSNIADAKTNLLILFCSTHSELAFHKIYRG